jgi:hypothetical protein
MITFDISFSLDDLEAPLLEFKDQVQRKYAMDLWSELIANTDIDTGRARAGWSMGMEGKDDFEPYEARPEGWKSGRKPYYKKPKAPVMAKGADYIMVYNNVHYIVPLNNGTSLRPGRFFVERAVEEVKAKMRREI